MGATFSGQAETNSSSTCSNGGVGLGDLPESCVALILSYLDPPEICKLALVNYTFRRASSADSVWELRLPENHDILIKKLLHNQYHTLTKKQMFARLCQPVRFDDCTKECWLQKNEGLCVAISWRGLKITGINDRRRWSHLSSDESRFSTVAYLQETWWLEVHGNLEFEFPAGIYSLFFRLQLGRSSKKRGRRVVDLEQVVGWHLKPIQFHLSWLSTADASWRTASSEYILGDEAVGEWKYYHVGDFIVENSRIRTKVEFFMSQIDCTHRKGGICFDLVLICPSSYSGSLDKLGS
ncbi:hypothetical protein Leryth_013201 [Lithospermum erythrorhizon]|uniref:F-box domain-containing protein n=1 Tax=Lithospermum erythrorhizon TaxID=34254 RepID=A0AAV3RZ05_LITER|nr:hypothetical protein Leryth_013201 [Lithospermum erythrorhizon]